MNTYWPSIDSDYREFAKNNKLSFCEQCGRVQQYVPLFTKKMFIVTCFHGDNFFTSENICSSCGELKSQSNYCNNVGLRVKTICDDCTKNPLTPEIMQGVKEALIDFRRQKYSIISEARYLLEVSVARDEFIKKLLELPPNARLVVKNNDDLDGETYFDPCIDKTDCVVTNDPIYSL